MTEELLTITQIADQLERQATNAEFVADGIVRVAYPEFLIRSLRAAAPTQAAADVLAERRRQVSAEGWTAEHDDDHSDGVLEQAAACYALGAAARVGFISPYWPFGLRWWKPGKPRRMLVKAGALILAAIERIDRAEGAPKTDPLGR